MKKIGEGLKTWKLLQPDKQIHSSRVIGWTLRVLMKIHAVTGDGALLLRARNVARSVDKYRGKTPSAKTGITYHWLARSIYGGHTHNMSEDYDLPWQMAVGLYGVALYVHDANDHSVLPVLADVSNYMVDWCVDANGVVVDALAVADHLDFNPKALNDGVNTWIPSALAVAYRATLRPETLELARRLFDANKTAFGNAGEYYHWYHTVGEVLGK
jgi:hypothetical protein